MAPWNEIAIDLIGPWKAKLQGLQQEIKFNALTCIDPISNLVELIQINNKAAEYVGQQFENAWLSHYPRPNHCIYDKGGEFIGEAF